MSDIPAIISLPMPKMLAVPLTATAKVQTHNGQIITAGQTIALAEDADICSPADGVAGEPQYFSLATANAETALCLPIMTHPSNNTTANNKTDSTSAFNTPDSVIAMLKKFGIVGLGGAGVAAKRKYRPNARLLINALESDETIACDRALLADVAPHLAAKCAAIAAFLGVTDTIIAVRKDAPSIAAANGIQVRRFDPDYALGAERMLIKNIYQLSPPPNIPPADYGILCFNLGTCLAMADMILTQTPMTTRVITVRHDNIILNIRTPFGASLTDIAAFANIADISCIKVGGIESQTLTLPHAVVCAKTNGIDFSPAETKIAMPCIRCGECLPACPQNLSPLNLFALWQDKEITRMQNDEALQSCILCRRCDDVCPSDIPLAAAFADARQQWRVLEDEQQTATARRTRYDNHVLRLSEPPRFAKLHPAALAAEARHRAEKFKKNNPNKNDNAGNLPQH
ncbi:MAG: 4Fe-4S dicluster domain-containing protein [Gammaproteobacteria bacterium WSBS_2016_MAG_OTU1]